MNFPKRTLGAALVTLMYVAATDGCDARNLIGDRGDAAVDARGNATGTGGHFVSTGGGGGSHPNSTGGAIGTGAGGSGGSRLPSTGGAIGTGAGGSGGSSLPSTGGAIGTGTGGSGIPQGTGGTVGCSTYPASGFYGANIFNPALTNSTFSSARRGIYEIGADVPAGQSLTFTMTALGAVDQSGQTGWFLNTVTDWRFTTFDFTTGEQRFMSTIPGRNEGAISFGGTGSARVDFYECGSTAITKTMIIKWAP